MSFSWQKDAVQDGQSLRELVRGPSKCREKTLINTKFLNSKVCFGGPRSYWNTPKITWFIKKPSRLLDFLFYLLLDPPKCVILSKVYNYGGWATSPLFFEDLVPVWHFRMGLKGQTHQPGCIPPRSNLDPPGSTNVGPPGHLLARFASFMAFWGSFWP